MAPGTNYMGGRRNAARAKSRDTVGRAQKHHFSRQRLDIISNGLGPGRRPPSVGKYQPTTAGFGLKATADIGLSHARRQVLGDIAIPFAPPQTPTHLTTAQTHAAHSSSGSRSSTSRVLEALNSSEPIAMRSVRNRILSMPDLAGLSTSFGNAVMPLQTPATKRRRSRSPSGSAESDSFVVEREERKHKRMRHMEEEEPSPFVHRFDALEGYDTTSEADEQEEHNVIRHSLPEEPGPAPQISSPTSSATCFAVEPEYCIDYRVAEALLKDPYNSLSRPFESQDRSEYTARPAAVSLSCNSAGFNDSIAPRISTIQEPPDDSFLLRVNLYDYSDPWNAIGAILGLEQQQEEPHFDADVVLGDDVGGQDKEDEAEERMSDYSEETADMLRLTRSQPQLQLRTVDEDAPEQSRWYGRSPTPDFGSPYTANADSPLTPLLSFHDSDNQFPAQQRPQVALAQFSPPPLPSPRTQIRMRIPIVPAATRNTTTPPRARARRTETTLPLAPRGFSLQSMDRRRLVAASRPVYSEQPHLEDDPDSDSDSEKENNVYDFGINFANKNFPSSNTSISMSTGNPSRPRSIPNSSQSTDSGNPCYGKAARSDDHVENVDGDVERRMPFSSLVSAGPRSSPIRPSSNALFSLSRRSSPLSEQRQGAHAHVFRDRDRNLGSFLGSSGRKFEKFPTPGASQEERRGKPAAVWSQAHRETTSEFGSAGTTATAMSKGAIHRASSPLLPPISLHSQLTASSQLRPLRLEEDNLRSYSESTQLPSAVAMTVDADVGGSGGAKEANESEDTSSDSRCFEDLHLFDDYEDMAESED